MVLDNASIDGSVEAIAAAYPDVQVVRLAENHGYAGNNNVGIRLALEQGADWVFVLNEDTAVAPDCLEHLVATAALDGRVGILGPMVYTWGEDRIISSAGGRVDWRIADAINEGAGEPDRGEYPAREVDFINGCGLLIGRAALERAGLLDETFFIYYEETDWCQRVRKAGFRVRFEPGAMMRHKAPIAWDQLGPSTLYYMTRNRLRFFARHTPRGYWIGAMAHALDGALRGSLRHWRAGRREHAKATWYAVWHAGLRRWGKAEAALWQSNDSDRTLSLSAPPAPQR
jgi:GT2 family glycosyltransferase